MAVMNTEQYNRWTKADAEGKAAIEAEGKGGRNQIIDVDIVDDTLVKGEPTYAEVMRLTDGGGLTKTQVGDMLGISARKVGEIMRKGKSINELNRLGGNE